jgi:hypothetical protein
MPRIVRVQVASRSAVLLLLALGASATLSAPIAAAATPAAPAHASKKSKKHKKAKKRKAVKKVDSVKVTAGTETLTFDSEAVQALEKAKVSVVAASPATGALASGYVFPLSGGNLNPGSGFGSLSAGGAIVFSTSFGVPGLFSSGSEATISEPSLALGSASTLSFTSQQATPPTFPFATVGLKGVHPTVDGAVVTLSDLPVSLTSTGVQFLSGFATGAFTAGETVGALTVQASASS